MFIDKSPGTTLNRLDFFENPPANPHATVGQTGSLGSSNIVRSNAPQTESGAVCRISFPDLVGFQRASGPHSDSASLSRRLPPDPARVHLRCAAVIVMLGCPSGLLRASTCASLRIVMLRMSPGRSSARDDGWTGLDSNQLRLPAGRFTDQVFGTWISWPTCSRTASTTRGGQWPSRLQPQPGKKSR